MENAVQEFIEYLRVTRKSSDNTLVSYRRDLNKLTGYLQEVREISDWKAVTETDLNAYLLYLEKGSYAASSISRSVASCHAFFQYLRDRNRISSDPSRMLRPPKAERKLPGVISVEEVDALLSQPSETTAKGLRDRAMLELLYATGIRVSELIGLKMEHLNLQMEYVICEDRTKERIIPFGNTAKKALAAYAREMDLPRFLKLGKGEEKMGGRNRDAIIADMFEAMLGALYLDQGYGAITNILDEVITPRLAHPEESESFHDYKTRLQEYVQADSRRTVHYELVSERGPSNAPVFVMNAIVDGVIMGTGEAGSKKQAEQNAAKDALYKMAV